MEEDFEDREKLGSSRNSVGLLKCQFCFISFYTHAGLKIHLKIYHESTLDMATLHNQQQKVGDLLCPEKAHANESFVNDNLTDCRVKIEDISFSYYSGMSKHFTLNHIETSTTTTKEYPQERKTCVQYMKKCPS